MWSVELSCPGLLLPVESGCLISETPTVDGCWSCAGPLSLPSYKKSFGYKTPTITIIFYKTFYLLTYLETTQL